MDGQGGGAPHRCAVSSLGPRDLVVSFRNPQYWAPVCVFFFFLLKNVSLLLIFRNNPPPPRQE